MFQRLIARRLIHQITAWSLIEGEYGSLEFEAPQQFQGRWRDVAELFVSPRGREEVSNSRVIVPDDFEVKVGDYLFFGETTEADPRDQTNAYPIRQIRRVANLTGNAYLKTAIL